MPARSSRVSASRQPSVISRPLGRARLTPGEAKCTYGTGSFLLNTGTDLLARSRHGLLTTVAYKIGDQPPVYALGRIDSRHRLAGPVVP